MASLVHPREVFSAAIIEDRAASIIIGHNHPSGTLDISEQDREVTKRIRSAGELLGIRLMDGMLTTGEEIIISQYRKEKPQEVFISEGH